MVGRGGRSRACFVCRRRRLRCDEGKPQCIRCKVAGFVCTGYPEGLPFINTDPASWQEQSAPVRSVDRFPQDSLIVLDDDTFRAYLKHEHQKGTTLMNDRWPGFSALDMSDGLPRQCITSLAAMLFGRRKGSPRACDEGVRLYVDCLRKLNDHLSRHEIQSPGTVALSIGILSVCEVCLVATSNSGWIQHMIGCAEYYRLCSFDMFQDVQVLRQFESVRFWLITATIAAKRSTFLDSEEWRFLPWSYAGVEKSQRQQLVDHATELPALYSDFIRYRSMGNSTRRSEKSMLLLSLETRLQRLLHDLREWEANWSNTITPDKISPYTEVGLSRSQARKYGFATRISFPASTNKSDPHPDELAFTCLQYNTTLILLFELWKGFRRAQPQNSRASSAQSSSSSSSSEEESNATTSEGANSHDMLSRPQLSASPHIPTTAPNAPLPSPSVPSPPTSTLHASSRKAALKISRILPAFQDPATHSWKLISVLTTFVRMALVVLRQDANGGQQDAAHRQSPTTGNSVTAAWLEDVVRELGEARRGWQIGRYMMEGYGYYN